ncbi:pectinesterase-like [Henckelia pumila]|uniref:pectinesterase-like n=1 Tax=Henckelia pumila TaxID=405737 RepID=UPI003C6E8937
MPENHRKTLPEIISGTVNVSMEEIRESTSNCSALRRKLAKKLEPIDLRALDDCLELFSLTISQLRKVLADLSTSNSSAATTYYDDLLTLLSGAMTNQATCLDGFSHSKNDTRKLIEGRVKRISKHFSNCLAMVKKLKKKKKKKKHPRSLLQQEFPEYGGISRDDGFPAWLNRKDRRLLQTTTNQTKVDLVVAKDGSGNFSTVNAALSAAPNNSNTRFVIYVKTGAYFEYVDMGSSKKMIMLLGDGIQNTWIKGNRSVGDGWTTFQSSTFAVVGNGFIAKGISFENYAGPSKQQAVAVRSGADFSAFYQCRFIGYQDTLYVHSLRQFYRECDVYGTVDFIFGNAAVVLQNCSLYARKPNPGQQNVFTAQGRDDPNQNTGISIHYGKVAAGSDLLPVLSQFKSYLGRPWKLYSRTVYMLANMEGLIDPAGWLRWDQNSSVSLLYYGEYQNRGPGSNTSARVTWPGYRVITNATEAALFAPGNFIQANQWVPATGIPFTANLTV